MTNCLFSNWHQSNESLFPILNPISRIYLAFSQIYKIHKILLWKKKEMTEHDTLKPSCKVLPKKCTFQITKKSHSTISITSIPQMFCVRYYVAREEVCCRPLAALWALTWAQAITSFPPLFLGLEPRATFVPTREQNLQSYYLLSMGRATAATAVLKVRFQVVLESPLQPFLVPSDK